MKLWLVLFLLFASPVAAEVFIDDVSRLNPTPVSGVVQHHDLRGLQDALAFARESNLTVSIAGKRHSMGGHAFYNGSLVLDMNAYDEILHVDPVRKTIAVQSGATWDKVIRAANEHNLSVQVMQAYTGFTVGGSMSVNVHESDPRFGPMVESVRSFRILLANGTVLHVSRAENPELFALANGGYGLFGVILDVELNLTENNVYERREAVLDYREYPAFFRNASADPAVEHVFARLSIVPGEDFLRETIATVYAVSDRPDPARGALVQGSTRLKRFLFGLSRSYDWGKRLRWHLQRERSFEPLLVSRNNLMYGNVSYLEYSGTRDTDILQEYFVPEDRFPAFTDDLRRIVEENDLNLLSATVRHVPRNNETALSYSAAQDSFGVVLYFNVGLSDEEQANVRAWTQELTARALAHGGTYYLPYGPYATREQFLLAYPGAPGFAAKKLQYDPGELFVNSFYAEYIRTR